MMLAWLSLSLTTQSPCSSIEPMTPTLTAYPLWKVSDASVRLNAASRRSSSSCSVCVPAMVRTAPVPAPHSSAARDAASTSRGCVLRPR